MPPHQHRLAQWQKLFLDTIATWTLLSILLSVMGTAPTWAIGVSSFITLYLASTMYYLNKDNFLSDTEILMVLGREGESAT